MDAGSCFSAAFRLASSARTGGAPANQMAVRPDFRVGYLFGCCSLTSKSVEEGICWRRPIAGSEMGWWVVVLFGLGLVFGFMGLDAGLDWVGYWGVG